MMRIVVGIDGEASSRHTLQWAVAEAEALGGELDVVMARGGIRVPEAWDGPIYRPRTAEELASDRAGLQALVDSVLAETASSVPVHVRTVVGRAVPVLLAESKTADRLIVGGTGTGGVVRALMGSVSDEVKRHASCPVIVVPSAQRGREPAFARV